MPNDDIKDDVTEDQVQEDQAQAEDDLPDVPEADSDDEEWTEEDMRLLSPEERAALFGNEAAPEADAGDEEEGGDEGDEGDEAAPDEAAQAEAEEEDEATETRGTVSGSIDTLDAEIEALDKAKEDVFDKWEEGDISRDEYLAKLKELDTESKALVAERAQIAARDQAVYDAFIETARGYFKEYPELATEAHAQAYDQHVRAVTGDERFAKLSHRQMLEAAHRLYVAEAELLGQDVPAPKSKAKPQAEPKPEAQPQAEAPKPRKRPGDNAPKTLANVPSAQSVSVSDGKYSALAQRLEKAGPEEYERIMGSLSPDEAEAFASMDV